MGFFNKVGRITKKRDRPPAGGMKRYQNEPESLVGLNSSLRRKRSVWVRCKGVQSFSG